VIIIQILLDSAFLLLLFQQDLPQEITVKDFTTGSKIISALLTLIAALICYIWRQTLMEARERHIEQKALAEKRHQDTMRLFEKMDTRQDALEKEISAQSWQLWTFRGMINKIQGKDIDYDNPMPNNKQAR